MQLVAYGAQDIYLTGNPQITFFKVVYRRHTNFSMESIVQTFSGSADFGNEVVATISRNGDLVGRMYLEHSCTFTHGTQNDDSDLGLVERYGDSLIKECEIEIGGQRIDKHTSMWNRVYSDLTEFNPTGYFGPKTAGSTGVSAGNGTLYQLMTGNHIGVNTEASAGDDDFGVNSSSIIVNGFNYNMTNANIVVNNIFLPLNFWFNRNPGLALPLIALQYHEVKVKMTFESLGNLVRTTQTANFANAVPATVAGVASLQKPTPTMNLWCDYIYLDTDERRRFAQVSHEYLIEQLQYSDNTITSASPSIDLNFNHPVKELVWTMRNTTGGVTGGRHTTLTADEGDPTSGPVSIDRMGGNFQLKLNGHDRFKERDSKYFTRTQVWQHHTGYGGIPTEGIHANDAIPDTAVPLGGDSIAVYSFALKPEEHQPSGTCNFSRIDNAQLVGSSLKVSYSGNTFDKTIAETASNIATVTLTIYAVNYNVLRIMSGMGGLAYSN